MLPSAIIGVWGESAAGLFLGNGYGLIAKACLVVLTVLSMLYTDSQV